VFRGVSRRTSWRRTMKSRLDTTLFDNAFSRP
jgi:hypothetical protein